MISIMKPQRAKSQLQSLQLEPINSPFLAPPHTSPLTYRGLSFTTFELKRTLLASKSKMEAVLVNQ